MNTQYIMIGHCMMDPSKQRGGTICRYTGGTNAFEVIGTFHPELNIGYQIQNKTAGTIYAVDEYWSQRGKTGGGGNVVSLLFDPAGKTLTLQSQQRTFCANPSGLCLSADGKRLLVVHHGTDSFVTRLVCNSDGMYDTETCRDDILILLYQLGEDGSINGILDIERLSCVNEEQAHLHQVVAAPGGKYYLVNDKGMKSIHVYSIENDKIRRVSETVLPDDAEARYGVFTSDGVYIVNAENRTSLFGYAFDRDSGNLTLISKVNMKKQPENNPMIGDIRIHPNGEWIYVTLRTDNEIALINCNSEGALKCIETVSCEGRNPKGLCIAPDGKTLYCLNTGSGSIEAFTIESDGKLKFSGRVYQGGYPSNMRFITL